MKSLVRVICWKRSHVTELGMNKLQERKLESDIPKMKKVCPECKPENCPITIVAGSTICNPSKAYRCEKGHLTLIAPLGTRLHVCFGPAGEDFVNVEGDLASLPNMIDNGDISCNHVPGDQTCDAKLVAVDDFELSYPTVHGIKTRTRIGDLWDKHGIEPVRTGQYNRDGVYNESRSQQANKDRLARMQRDRNTSKDRQPGKTIKRATKKNYGHRDKSSVNPDRLE